MGSNVLLDCFLAHILLKAGSDITNFQTDPGNENLWNKMHDSIKRGIDSYDGPGFDIYKSVLVTLADGSTVWWSNSKNNTFNDSITKTINSPNVNTSPAAMTALLSTNGIGYSNFNTVSTARDIPGQYNKITTKFYRTGNSTVEPLGLICVLFRISHSRVIN